MASGISFSYGIIFVDTSSAGLVWSACMIYIQFAHFTADKLLSDSAGLPDSVCWLPSDGIRFAFIIGEGNFFTGLAIFAFSMADDEYGFFVATNAFEHVGDIGKADGVDCDCSDGSFNAIRVEWGFSCRRAGLCWRNFCRRTGLSILNSCGARASIGRACNFRRT